MLSKSAMVAGSTGLVGRELVIQLCEHPDFVSVVALARKPDPELEEKFRGKLVYRPLPKDADVLTCDEFYCALGTTIKKAGSQAAFRAVDFDLVVDLAKRAKAGAVKRVAIVSAIGSDPYRRFFTAA